MPSQDARDTALSAALAMLLTRLLSLFYLHVFRRDFQNLKSATAHAFRESCLSLPKGEGRVRVQSSRKEQFSPLTSILSPSVAEVDSRGRNYLDRISF